MDKAQLIAEVSPPLENQLTVLLVDEFLSLEKRYVLRDWEPATLDGGQFSEIISRILYHVDSGNLNLTKGVDQCIAYIEDANNSNSHSFPERKSVLHMSRVIRFCYKFRSDRGAVHINPIYTANQLDARLLIEAVRWLFSELLRIFWNGDRSEVEKVIKEILEFDVPVIGKYEDRLLIQRTDCTTEEEILILLHLAGTEGFSRTELGEHVEKPQSSVTRGIQKLSSNKKRLVIKLRSGNYRLTELGTKFLMDNLADKLTMM